jgi:hypothetical protein
VLKKDGKGFGWNQVPTKEWAWPKQLGYEEDGVVHCRERME